MNLFQYFWLLSTGVEGVWGDCHLACYSCYVNILVAICFYVFKFLSLYFCSFICAYMFICWSLVCFSVTVCKSFERTIILWQCFVHLPLICNNYTTLDTEARVEPYFPIKMSRRWPYQDSPLFIPVASSLLLQSVCMSWNVPQDNLAIVAPTHHNVWIWWIEGETHHIIRGF